MSAAPPTFDPLLEQAARAKALEQAPAAEPTTDQWTATRGSLDPPDELAEPAPAVDVAGIAARAASRAVNRAQKKHAEDSAAGVGGFAQPSARFRSHLRSFLPDGNRLQVYKRQPNGSLAWVADYTLRDVAGYANVHSFIRERLFDPAKPPFEWSVVEITSAGKESAPIPVGLDPPEDPNVNASKETAAELRRITDSIADNADPVKLAAKFKALKAAIGGDDDAETDDYMAGFLKILMFREMQKALDPTPALPPMSAPAGDSDAIALLKAQNAELKDRLDKQERAAAIAAAVAPLELAVRNLTEIVSKGGKGGGSDFDSFFDKLQKFKAITEGDGSAQDYRFANNVLGMFQSVREKKTKQLPPKEEKPPATQATATETKPAADKKTPTEAAAEAAKDVPSKLPPEGFKKLCTQLAEAKEDEQRIAIAWSAFVLLANKTADPEARAQVQGFAKLLRLLAQTALDATKDDGDRAAARGELRDGIATFLTTAAGDGYIDEATRAATLAAFEAHLDDFAQAVASAPVG